MATFNYKKNRVDRVTTAVLDLGLKETSNKFEKFFDKAIGKASNLAKEENVKSSDIKATINNIKIDSRGLIRQTYNVILLSGITSVILDQRMNVVETTKLKPIKDLLSIYPVSNPILLAKKMDRLSIAYVTKSTANLNQVEKRAFKFVSKYFRSNHKFIQTELMQNKKAIQRITQQVKTNISKTIFKDLKKQIRSRVEETIFTKDGAKVITRPKTFQEIRKDMRDKFGKQVDYRVRRIVDTELHDMAEKAKFNEHILMGYTKKRWNTQGDSNVRDEKQANHEAMNGVSIPIKNKFRVKGGGTAMYPSDPNLPPRQRINCRCFLTFTR